MTRFGLFLASACLAACSSPANVAGSYTLIVKNGQNGCGFKEWTLDNSTTDVTFTLSQSGEDITGVVGGVIGDYLKTFVLGSNSFSGKVDGNQINLMLYGQNSYSTGTCTYTVNAKATGTINGEFISGNIDYTTKTNDSPDCAAVKSCRSTQLFNGTRPPA
jgi:hypothetical protein